jgi:predicted PurR-regulated permease PerM
MGLSVGEQLRWWGLGGAIFLLFLYFTANSIMPFVAGAALAYLLDPFADRLERIGCSRVFATVVITLLILISLFSISVVILPLLLDQIQTFATTAPQIIAGFQAFVQDRFPGMLEEGSVLRKSLASLGEVIQSRGTVLIERILASSLAVFDFLILVVVTPVVAFYLLVDWDHMIARIDSWLPREHAQTIRSIMREIDRVLSGFVRGQLTVCLILGSFYATSLTLIGLPFGLIIGLFAGLVSFIPFVGSIMGGALSLGVALFHFWSDPIWIVTVAIVFVIGQVVEGNYLTPRIVGDSVGLHPVWLMFALACFGSLLGFTGLMIAVPAAAALGVLSRFALDQYLSGRLYRGPEPPSDETQ